LHEANLARLYALNCSFQNLHSTSISWWITALELYQEIQEQEYIRISIDQIIINLNTPDWYIPDEIDLELTIKKLEQLIPEILNLEKKKIITLMRDKIM
jgi:hypothetical protein